MSHQADRALVDDLIQDHEVLVLGLILRTLEMVVQVVLELGLLLAQLGEVDEKPGAHVALHGLDLLGPGWPETAAKEVAVFQEPAAPDLLGVPRRDQLLVQVVQGLAEVPVHGLGHHGGVEVVPDGGGVAAVAVVDGRGCCGIYRGRRGCRRGRSTTVVEEEQSVEHDVERVDGELVLPPHGVDELQLDGLGAVVAEGDQAPPVAVVDLHHLGHVGLLEAAGAHPFPAHALGQQLHQAFEDSPLNPLVRFRGGQVHGEDEIEVVVGDFVFSGKIRCEDARGSRSVQPDFRNGNAVGL